MLRSTLHRTLQSSRIRSIHRATYNVRDYDTAVQALNTLQSNSAAVEAVRTLGPAWNQQALPKMRGWVHRIGYEPSDFNALNLIHMAGTKGKGSSSTFISSILAQYLPTERSIHAERLPTSVGLYTSPHLRFVRERIKIDNQPISEEIFAKYFWDVWDRLEGGGSPEEGNDADKPVYFHFLTLMAFHCYMQEKVGTAVIECGIGGEYDTTNIIVKPLVTGVTSLGIDHVGMLGSSIESIAWHKSGIFKEGVPAFTVPQPPEALRVLQSRAVEKETELHVVGEHHELKHIQLGLDGDFQRTNASLAIAICTSQLSRLGYSGLPNALDPQSKLPAEFIAGLEKARLGGRCDMRMDTKCNGLTWYIDGGHTLESIDLAARWFGARAERQGKREKVLIFNQQTRDAPALARRLHNTLASVLGKSSPFKHAIFCTNITYREGVYKSDLASMNVSRDAVESLVVQRNLATAYGEIDSEASVHVVHTIEDAIELARDVTNGSADILVTGSLHLVGGVIEILESEAASSHAG